MPRLALALALVATPAAAQTADEAAAGKVLDAFHAAAARADGPAYFGLFAREGVFIGTDVSERWTVEQFKAYAAPSFARGRGWTYTPRVRHIAVTADPCRCTAWFDEVLDSASYGTSRGTGVLVKEGQDWKVAQYALTFPIPNDLGKGFTDQIKAFEAKQKP
jgi:hypothetical protein